MRVAIIGGGGLMARATARDLIESRPDIELVLADLNVDAAREVADSLPAGSVDAGAVDASDVESVREVIRGSDAVINAAHYYFNLDVMQAALLERIPYVDLGGLFHMTLRQLQLHDEFERAGVTAVIGMGSTPGITNVQARHAVGMLDRAERIGVYCANTPEADAPEAWGYSIHTIIDELTKAPMVFRDGELRELEPLAEPEEWEFLPPIGRKEVHHSLHSEIATLPFSFADHGVRECFFKLNYFGYTPAALRSLKSMLDDRPRDEVIAELMAMRGRRTDADEFVVDHEEVAVEVHGELDGRAASVRIDTMGIGRPDWGISGGTLLTATPPGIVAVWLADGTLRAPGVHPPETVVDPERLFSELDRRGMRTEVVTGR